MLCDVQPPAPLGLSSLLTLTFSGIYGVGKAAEHPPALAVLSHTPNGATQTIAWVGKGIVYDTGGLSIKGKVFVLFPVEVVSLRWLEPFTRYRWRQGSRTLTTC